MLFTFKFQCKIFIKHWVSSSSETMSVLVLFTLLTASLGCMNLHSNMSWTEDFQSLHHVKFLPVATAHAKVLNTICSKVCIHDYPVDTICSSWGEMGSRDEASRSNTNISEPFLAQFLCNSTGPQCIFLLLMQWSESVFYTAAFMNLACSASMTHMHCN